MFGGQPTLPITVRMPGGGGHQLGSQHSHSLEVFFAHTPGLKVVYPATPVDAKALLKASIRDENPVIFLEHKLLYGAHLEGERRELPLGKARVVRPGSDVTIVTYGLGVRMAVKAAGLLAEEGTEAEVLDLITLKPYDAEAIFGSVRKTGKAVFLEEGVLTGGVGAELCAAVAENCLYDLDGGLVRVGARDLPVPCSPVAERMVLPNVPRVVEAVRRAVSP